MLSDAPAVAQSEFIVTTDGEPSDVSIAALARLLLAADDEDT